MNIDKLKEMGFNLIPLKGKSKEPIGGLNWKQFQEENIMVVILILVTLV